MSFFRHKKWTRQVAAQPLRMAPRPPWQIKAYAEATELIRKIWDLHGHPEMSGGMGIGPVGRDFYCRSCSEQWPCRTFTLVADYGTTSAPNGYEPLRLIAAPVSAPVGGGQRDNE